MGGINCTHVQSNLVIILNTDKLNLLILSFVCSIIIYYDLTPVTLGLLMNCALFTVVSKIGRQFKDILSKSIISHVSNISHLAMLLIVQPTFSNICQDHDLLQKLLS